MTLEPHHALLECKIQFDTNKIIGFCLLLPDKWLFLFSPPQPFHLPHLALEEPVDADLAPVGVEDDGGEAGDIRL